MTTYMNWSLEQWGEAIAWFARVKGYSPLPDHRGAVVVRHHWLIRHDGLEPSDKRLVLIDDRIDLAKRARDREIMLVDTKKDMQKVVERWSDRVPVIEVNLPWACELFNNAIIPTYPPRES